MNEPSKSKIKCPNCFVPFALKQTQFRCSNKACAPQNDPKYAHFLGVPQMMGFVISEPDVKAIKNGSSNCPQCPESTVIHICPNCHGEVPAKPWRSPFLTLAIVGSTGAGKSVYITVAMKNFTENLPLILGKESGVSTVTETTEEKVKSNEKVLFGRGEELAGTEGKAKNPDVRLPFLFNLSSWRYRSGFRPLTKKLNTFLSIYDAAGEDFNDQSDAHTLKQIPMADGLIMFIDPLSLPGFAQSIGKTPPSPQLPSEILAKFYKVYVLQQGAKLNMGDKIKVPTAFVLGKADLYEPWIKAQPDIMNVAEHKRGVDVQALKRSSTATEAVLDQLGGAALIEVIKNLFENFHFFSVKSGAPYKEAGINKFQVQPFRVLDPLLWIILQNNRVPALD